MNNLLGTNMWEEIVNVFTELGVSRGVAIAYLVVCALLVVMAIVALIMWIRVCIVYYKTNNIKTVSGKTSFQVAREVLDSYGLNHIKVERASFIRAWIFGNCYSITKKTVFLRSSIADKNSITAIGVALQKAGIARLCEEGNTTAKVRNKMQILSVFGPMLFLPIIIIGALVDFLVFKTLGTFSMVSVAISILIVASGFIVTLLNLPVERKACNMALEMLYESHVLNEDEIEEVKRVFKAYILAYVCDFIVAVLRIAQIVLEIVMNNQISANRE